MGRVGELGVRILGGPGRDRRPAAARDVRSLPEAQPVEDRDEGHLEQADGAGEGCFLTTKREEFREFALKSGLMKPCVICGNPVGGRCPPCDRFICIDCTVPVRVTCEDPKANGAVMWRCLGCAAEMVLKGEGHTLIQ